MRKTTNRQKRHIKRNKQKPVLNSASTKQSSEKKVAKKKNTRISDNPTLKKRGKQLKKNNSLAIKKKKAILSKKSRFKYKKRRRKRLLKEIFGAILLAAVLASLIASAFVSLKEVQGYGMSPTLRNDELVLLQKNFDIKRFDIVAFKRGEAIQVRRVIGLPGEKITYREDTLYVNDQAIDEKFIVSEINESQSNGHQFTEDFSLMEIISQQAVPMDQYLLLGDNRPYATDSRYYGLINTEQIIGKVTARLLPLETLELF
ncbi:signal peptidase I [Enterococcus sp. HY326]|uniref:signal peptidase I n=1 Tax=Enterococcus sp. HY326 TaxID=2971265 RepID=UPI00223F7EC0|nr:signal peptidase I [Enterococcus sp. HY326]